MAMLVPYSDPKLRKQSLLKDYLLDDLSSCSSSGFRSFPRRQCCTTSIRFLLEIDANNNKKKNKPPQIRSSNSAASVTPKSALQKASQLLVNAVKHLPFTASGKSRKSILPRSLSRRLFRRTFWKKSDRKEIEGWKSFHTVVGTDSPKVTAVTSAVIAAVKCDTGSISESSSGKSKKSYGDSSWSESSEFTSTSSSSSGNSETVNSSVLVLPEEEEVVGERVAVVNGEDSTDTTTAPTANCIIDSPKKQWSNEEAKEQFSPISVLDCPFDNDDAEAEEEVSSPFKQRLARVEGTKLKLMQKLRRFESVTQLEPVDLEKRIALSEFDHESVGSESSLHLMCLSPIEEHDSSDEEEEEEEEEKGNKTGTKALQLLEQMKSEIPTLKYNADYIFLDFFREGIVEENAYECELLEIAKDWINGQPKELFLGWEVQKNRQAYMKDMERGGIWANFEDYKQEVGLELEAEIFTSLVNDLFS